LNQDSDFNIIYESMIEYDLNLILLVDDVHEPSEIKSKTLQNHTNATLQLMPLRSFFT